MKQDGLLYFSDTYLTSLGLIIFFIFFASMLFWVNRRNSKALYGRLEHLPFEDGSEK